MAMYTNHPVSALPSAPLRETTGHLLLRAWCVLVLVLALAGVAVEHAVGVGGAVAIGVIATAVSAVLWAVIRPPIVISRLPWLAIGYLAWATLALAWGAWPGADALTWALLTATAFQSLFIGAVLSWRDVVRAIASAAKWIVAASLLFELAVAVIVRGPLFPGFATSGSGAPWSSGALFTGGPLQGVFGDANLLAPAMIVAIVVFAIRFAAGAPRPSLLVVWITVAAFLFIRSGSATGAISAVFVLLVLATVLLMRTTRRPGERTRWYLLYALVGLGGVALLWLGPGRDLVESDGVWIETARHLGPVGVFLLALVYSAYLWRSWFFAVDRPRWDLLADRPYSPLTLLPTLIGALLTVQGLGGSAALLPWGWMFVVLLGAKIKQAPHVGIGPGEQSIAIERGELHGTTR